MARNQLPGPFPFRFLYWQCPQYPFHMPSLRTRLRRPCKGAGASQREVRWVCRSLPLSSAAVRPQVIYILPDPTHDHTRMIFAPLEFAVTVLLHVLVPHALLTRWVVSFRPALPPLSRHLYSIDSDRWGTPNQEAGNSNVKALALHKVRVPRFVSILLGLLCFGKERSRIPNLRARRLGPVMTEQNRRK